MAPIYEEFLSKFRWQAAHLSDKVPWRTPAAPGVMLQKQHNALQRTYVIRGLDLSGETKEAQGALMLAANDVLKRPGGAWMIHSESQRVHVAEDPESEWDNIVAKLIEDDRRQHIFHNPGSRETRYFLTLTWKPPHPVAQRWSRLVVKQPNEGTVVEPDEVRQAASLKTFLEQSDYLMYLLRGMLAMGRPTFTDEMLTYLHTTVSDRWHPVRCPVFPLDIDVRLCDTDYSGGWYPKLGEWHLRTCSITSYPAASIVGMVKALEAKDIDFRWVVRWIAEDKQAQGRLLHKTEKAWVGQERSFWDRMAENASGQETRVKNTDATNKAEQVDAARQEAGADVVAFGKFTGTVTTWDTDPGRADAKLLEIMQVFESQGFVTTREKEHATAAWLSSHPGNRVDSVRRTPQKSLTLAHLMPGLQSAWMGPERDEHLNAPAWFLVHSEGNTLFRVVNHVLDNGHFLTIGPTRSGKSVLAGFMVAQWFKYPGAQVFWFDIDGSARCLTHCLGGHWYDLGSGQVGFQPFRRVHDPVYREWVYGWVLRRLTEDKVTLSEDVRGTLRDGLERLMRASMVQRTMQEFVHVLTAIMRATEGASRNRHSPYYSRLKLLLKEQSHVVKALSEHIGGILDADHDDLQDGPLHTFDQRTLLTMPHVVPAVLEYLFHELESRFDTRTPTLIPMDDAAITWAIPDYEKNGKKWMTTTAKRNVSLGFFTHSLTQVFESPLGSLLQESCASVYAMPNPQAQTPRIAAIYEQLGYNEEEIGLIARMRPQRECYYSSALLGKQKFRLDLSPFMLSMLGRNRAEDHERMNAILAAEGRDGFATAWLRSEGFEHEAMQVEQWQKERLHAAD